MYPTRRVRWVVSTPPTTFAVSSWQSLPGCQLGSLTVPHTYTSGGTGVLGAMLRGWLLSPLFSKLCIQPSSIVTSSQPTHGPAFSMRPRGPASSESPQAERPVVARTAIRKNADNRCMCTLLWVAVFFHIFCERRVVRSTIPKRTSFG